MPASRHSAPASITIRNLDPALKERLRVRSAQHGQSMEAEARRILQTVLTPQEAAPVRHLYDRVRARFAPLGGVDIDLPTRSPVRERMTVPEANRFVAYLRVSTHEQGPPVIGRSMFTPSARAFTQRT